MEIKKYVLSILYMSAFGIIVELFLPKSNLKKYVSSVISLFVILTIVSPIFNFLKSDKIEETLDKAIVALSLNSEVTTANNEFKFEDYTNKVILSRVKENLEKEMYTMFSEKLKDITEVTDVQITLDDSYKITQVEVYIQSGDLSSVKIILDRIIETYEIPSAMLKIIKEGV